MDDDQKFHTVRGYQLLEQNNKILTSSMEDYLEMIYRYSLTEGYVRVNMISELLNVQASSATKMVQKLSELGMIDYKKYGIIFMTDMGREIGQYLLHRHHIIEAFLINLGVTENLLIETELIEHNISADTLKRLSAFNSMFKIRPDLRNDYKNILEQI